MGIMPLVPPVRGSAQASIVQKEGIGALFKGCLVRACWTAPLGAFNFAGGPPLSLMWQVWQKQRCAY